MTSEVDFARWFAARPHETWGSAADNFYAAHMRRQTHCGDRSQVQLLGPDRGKGLVALSAFSAGERIIVELPLLLRQSSSNKRVALVCSRCLAFAEPPSSHASRILERRLTEVETVLFSSTNQESERYPARAITCSANKPNMCQEIYCSIACRDADNAAGHSHICAALNPAVVDFMEHAVATNETFLLALKAFGLIAERIRVHANPTAIDAVEAALFDFRLFSKDYWWNICLPDDPDDDTVELKAVLKTLLADSLAFLSKVFESLPGIKPLLTVNFYSLLMGLFEQNNLSIVNPAPLVFVLDSLPDNLKMEIIGKLSELLKEDCNDFGAEELDCDYSSAVDELVGSGSGLHILQATINHSCKPNAVVFKDIA
ncbi:hypothetical protein HDU82_004099, partial [Entophlyctis luteolus]